MTRPKRNRYMSVAGNHDAPQQPTRHGMGWRYHWDQVEPGGVVYMPDLDEGTSNRFRAAAAAAARRLGVKFATGKFYDNDDRHVGYWAVRYDGCEILEPEPTMLEKRAADSADWNQRIAWRARGERIHRRPAMDAAKPLGTADAVYAVEAPPVDMTPVVAEWSASPMPEVGAASEREAF